MSSLICWPTYYCNNRGLKDESSRHITLIADSVFSHTRDGKNFTPFFDSGPKVSSLPVRSFGFSQDVNYADSFGLGFVGNTILGQSALLLATNTFYNLHYTAQKVTTLPFLNEFAACIGDIAAELLKTYSAPQNHVEFILIGICPKTKKQTACHIAVTQQKIKAVPYLLEQEDDILAAGTDCSQILEEIKASRKKATTDFERVWMPKTVLSAYVERRYKNCIGGTIHGGMLIPGLGFVIGAASIHDPKRHCWVYSHLPPTKFTLIGRFNFVPHPMEEEWPPVFSQERPNRA